VQSNTLRGHIRKFFCVAVVSVALAACAGSPKSATDEVHDPFEPVNRVFFDFNIFLDKTVLRPVTRFYVNVVPEGFRITLHNILEILNTPIVATNHLLQGNVDGLMATLGRATFNLAGGAGLMDVSGDKAPFKDEDFGQTMAVWGAPGGPYLVLPFFGPSNVRDAIGTGVDSAAEPVGILVGEFGSDLTSYLFSGSKLTATALDKRSRILGQLEELEKTSLDFYATIRSLYQQKRRDDIRNGDSTDPLPIPEITFERDDSTPQRTLTPTPTKASFKPK
jgi:phospholipid-binding lipoprotein MlaA